MNAQSPKSERTVADSAKRNLGFWFWDLIRISCFGLLFFSVAGCEKYEALPLDQKAVNQRLAVPASNDLTARVHELKNPLLPTIQLHPEQGLSPDEAAVLAVVLNPSLREQRDARGISQAALLQAGLLPNPQLSFDSAWNTGGTVPGNISPYGVGVNYDITALISHSAKEHSAEFAAKSVDLQTAWQEWQVAEAAKSAVYDLMSAAAQQKVVAEVDDRLQENLKLVQQAMEMRLKTAIDLAAAESASRDAHAAVLQADRDVRRAQLALNRAMGFAPETKIQLRNRAGLAAGFTPPDASELLNNLELHRLDLVGLKQGYAAQEQTLYAATLDQFPKINLGFTRAVDNTRVRSVGLGVSIDIPIFDRNQGNIASEKATRQKLFDEYISRVFDAHADIAQALADISAINDQIKDAQAALPSLQKLVSVYKDAVDHGSADVLSYYTAWNTLAQKNLDLLKLEQELAQNRIALELASGRYFPEQLSTAATQATTLPGVTR